MTFFIQEQQPNIQARGVDTPLPSFWGGVSAGFQKEQLESNANFRAGREMIRTDDQLAVDAARHMGAERIGTMVEDFNARARAAGMKERELPADLADLPSVFGPNFSKAILEEARNDPEWAGPDVSPEASEARTNERLRKEYQDLTDTMNAMSGWRGMAEIAGGIGGALADVRNLPFLVLGSGGGSIARVMGREAMLNVAAESVTMPDRFEMAERLDIPEPSIASALAYAAAGGALLGGAVEGLARGITYWRGTRTGAPSNRVANYDQQLNADIAEDALADLTHPFERVRESVVETRAIDDVPFGDAPAMRAEVPEGGVPRQTRASDLFDQPDARGGVGERQMDLEELIAEAQTRDPVAQEAPQAPSPQPATLEMPEPVLTSASERDLQRQAGGNRPLIDHIKRSYGGIAPNSRIGQELRARGITPKDAPGLFRNQGRPGLDNIPASEEPQLAALLGQDGNGYLNEDAIADAILAEIDGLPTPVTREQADARAELDTRRAEVERQDRAAASMAGAELDEELFRMPEVPAWVDQPKEREAVLSYQTDDLRTRIERDGDMMVGDRSLSSILDELDADEEFASIIELCGRRNVA